MAPNAIILGHSKNFDDGGDVDYVTDGCDGEPGRFQHDELSSV